MRNRKILHLRSSGGLLGAENVIIELCKFSKQQGCEQIVGALKDKRDPLPEFLSYLPSGTDSVIFEGSSGFDFSVLKKLKSYIISNKIDLIHCHGYKEDFYAFLLGKSIKKFATNHLWKKTNLKGRIYALIDAFILRFFNCVVAVSGDIASEMASKGIKNIIQINNGIDVKQFFPQPKSPQLIEQYGLRNKDFIVGMVSSLTPEKGHLVAIEALSLAIQSNPEIKLIIVGDGTSKADIQNLIKRNGLEQHVILAGRQNNVPDYLSLFDVFLLPSYKEGLPMALLEAMASGKCVIASRVGEIPNVISDGKNGFLVAPGDHNGINFAINKAVSDNSLMKKCQHEAVETVKDKFSSWKMSEYYNKLYNRILIE